MSEDERLAKIKELLDSTIAEFESVFESAGSFDHSRVGNGWNPSSIPVQNHVLNMIPLDEAKRIADSRKARLFGPIAFLAFPSRRIESAGDPVLVFFPFWRATAYHECFYFRGKTYRTTVPDDVVAIQVDGRIRPLTAETKQTRHILGRIKNLVRRMLFARQEPRYFTVDGATELAYQFAEASVLVDGEGRESLSMAYLLEKKPSMQRLEERKALEVGQPTAKFAPLTFATENVVRLLHAKVVKPPAVFSKILTNRFEVTQLDLLELPVYVFRYKYLGRERELRIHGVTGESLR